MKFNTIFNHPRPISPHGGDVSMTDPQFLSDCDINIIIKRFAATGQLPPTRREGISGDFSDVGDFQQCLDRINRAKSEFEALPSDLRARFGNDPRSYVDFVLNPDNADECVRLGLRVLPDKHVDTAVDVLNRIDSKLTAPAATPST